MFRQELLNVPREPNLILVKDRRRSKDPTLFDRTELSIEVIIEVLSICVRFYQQQFDMELGSPLSHMLRNRYMENSEL